MRRRKTVATLLLASLLFLPSCLTTALWSQGNCEGFTAGEVAGRVALTPFTLLLDMLAVCVQSCGDGYGGHCHPCR